MTEDFEANVDKFDERAHEYRMAKLIGRYAVGGLLIFTAGSAICCNDLTAEQRGYELGLSHCEDK